MKRKRIILVLVIMLLLSQGVFLNAQELVVAYNTGNDYLKMSERIKPTYVLGLLDMYFLLTYLEFPESYNDIVAKMEGVSVQQIQEIFEKYLAEYPEYLRYAAANNFFEAMHIFVFEGAYLYK